MSRLRLREVRLSGFKTFADKTTIAFTPGITAIVGPNGSGKSNVVDALRWALGEAGRGIRSKRVDEVIFAGSERRRPLHRAGRRRPGAEPQGRGATGTCRRVCGNGAP